MDSFFDDLFNDKNSETDNNNPKAERKKRFVDKLRELLEDYDNYVGGGCGGG